MSKAPQKGPRRQRVQRTIKSELSELLARHLQDRRLSKGAFASVNQVELNRDMSIARIYVSFIGGSEAECDRAFKAVSGAAGRLRGPLARRMSLARAPELRFIRDESVEFVAKVSDIVRDDERRAVRDSEDAVEPNDVVAESE